MPLNSSNPEKSPLFTPKGHLRVCWVILIILQLERTATENASIDTFDTINTIERIYWINQYEDNKYDRSDKFTRQTPPTQLYHRCLFFRFSWLIKLRSIVVLHLVSYCWYEHPWFIFCLCLPINPTVVPTVQVRLLSLWGMDYCCVYHGQLFLPIFLLLTEPYYSVTGAIKFNKEDLTIISSLNQYDDHQISDVILSIWECDKVDRSGARGIQSAGTVDSAKMSIIYVTTQNNWYTWTYQVATTLTYAEVILSLSTNLSSNH